MHQIIAEFEKGKKFCIMCFIKCSSVLPTPVQKCSQIQCMIWITIRHNFNLGQTIVQNLVSEQNLKRTYPKECTALRGSFLPCFASDLNNKFSLDICIKKQTLAAKASTVLD